MVSSAYFRNHFQAHLDVARATMDAVAGEFEAALATLAAAVRGGGKILFCGNGGSAADAQHLATELFVRYVRDRNPIAAIALTTDSSALTAAGNDYGYEHVFARQVHALGREGDVLVAISTSGHSPNVLGALEQARALGMRTIGLSGRDGGDMGPLCDVLIVVPARDTAHIQEMHITIGHMLCGALETELGLTEG